MNRKRTTPRLLLVLPLLLPLLAACGAEPTPTSPPPTDTARPAATSRPTDTPEPADTPTPESTDTPEPTNTPAPEPTDTPVPTPTPVAAMFEEAPCPFDLPAGQVEGETVECGYLLVPEDRADPGSRTIRLAVAVFHQPDGDPEPDPILYLEGGPGSSPLELVALTFSELYEPVFAANRDLVLFDQRGVGLSEPALDCPAVVELEMELLDDELDGKGLNDQEMYDLILEALLDCEEDLQAAAELSAYNTNANAADVDDLRRALGYGQVNLWGISYGTRLALEVMRDYPEGVRSVVLDSIFPPGVDSRVETPASVARALDVLYEGCAADEACSAAYPDLRTSLYQTVDRLNETPASIQVTNPLTGERHDAVLDGDGLVALVAQILYDTDILPSLPEIIYDASQDDFELSGLLLGALLAVRETVSDGMLFSVRCHDEIAFSSQEAFETALTEYPQVAGLFEDSAAGRLSYEACAEWDSGQADASENEAVSSDIPVLIMAGEYDPVSPPARGQQAAEALSNSYFFEYPGVGHGASAVGGCPQEMMIAFLDDPTTAPDDACIAEMDLPQFVVPVEAGAIELEPFTNEQMSIQGLVPAGWTEVSLGVYSRGRSAMDTAVLLAQAAPVSAEDLLALVSSQLGLEEPPEVVGEREANGLTWTLYAVTVMGLELDMALAEADGLALIVLLQSDPGEHEVLYEAVFLPVVDALVTIE